MFKQTLHDSSRIGARTGFLFLDKCRVTRTGNKLVACRNDRDISIPTDSYNVLMFGPGSSITHQAVALMARDGVSAVWVGDGVGVWYAQGYPLTRSNELVVRQARIVSDEHSRRQAAIRLYELRFRGMRSLFEECDTVKEMQLAEARLMKNVYSGNSKRTGVSWVRRDTSGALDAVNNAMTLAHSCLYAITSSVIGALSLSPGLGVVHHGNYRAFVLDIADVYKERTTIPISFDLASASPHEFVAAKTVRAAMRESLMTQDFIRRMVKDIFIVLGVSEDRSYVTFTDANEWWKG